MKKGRFAIRGLFVAIAAWALVLQGCAGRSCPVLGRADSGADADQYIDSHFHISNYAMQGVPLKQFIDEYMGDKVLRSTAMTLPLQQEWSPYEHYAHDKTPPNYYMGPKAELYYYSFIDALLAAEYLRLSETDKARIDPMITAFNPMDLYAPQHIERVLLTFPGVFSGIGEFTVHKEIVSDKLAGDPIKKMTASEIPEDVDEEGKVSLYSPALENVFHFAGEAGLVAVLHSDVYAAKVTHDGTPIQLSPEAPFTAGTKHLCAAAPNAKVIWAHTGLGRFVKPAPNHLDVVSEILDACPNWNVDISWDLVQSYIVSPATGMPTLADWARFITKYQDRVLWGSDTVIYSRNKIDDKGDVKVGTPMSVAEYLAVPDIAKPLWQAVGPDVSRKVRITNHMRLFDAAKAKVRGWEAAHAKDDLWNLSPQ